MKQFHVVTTTARFRNDVPLNSYNRVCIMSWLANIDIAPCTGNRALLDYLGKYATKAEKQTKSYSGLVTEILPKISAKVPLLSAISKLMNRLVGETCCW